MDRSLNAVHSNRLSGLKIAVTSPPSAWFGEVDHKFAADMARELREMGAELLEIDIARLSARDPEYVAQIIADLRQFQPDVALATPNAGYAILCTDLKGATSCATFWRSPRCSLDHGALQFSGLLLGPLPENFEESQDGCIGRMRKELDHPLFIHYSPDRGHTAVMRDLGILVDQPVHPFVHIAFPAYTRAIEGNSGAASSTTASVVFAGNIYLDRAERLKFRENEALAGIEAGMLAGKAERPGASMWSLLMEEIARLDEPARRALRLLPDASFFWRFMCDEIVAVGTTEVRLKMLTSLRREVEFHGNFVEPDACVTLSRRYGLRFGKMLDCVTELPALYRDSGIVVDAVHPGYISGTSPKITSCFAAGGLVLFDYRLEFRAAMGDIADSVMYRDTAHLNDLIEDYLGNPGKRREIARALQDRVLGGFTFAHLVSRMLVEEPAWRATRAARA